MLIKNRAGHPGVSFFFLLPLLLMPVTGLLAADITSINGGIWHSGAVDDTGAVWTWGSNSAGQLGDGTNNNAHYPVRVIDTGHPTGYLDDMSAMDGGRGSGGSFESHTTALKQDGTVWSWGWNAYGQLGVDKNSTPVSSVPVQIPSLSGISTIDAGATHSLALKSPEGTVWGWGQNANGRLGIASTTSESSTPVSVSGLAGITAIAAGDSHGLAVKPDTTVWAWGDGSWGALGAGASVDGFTEVLPPVQVVDQSISPLTGITHVDAGLWFSVARKSDGTVWTWGANESGQLGDGTSIYKNAAVQVSGLTNVTHIAAGGQHVLARKDDGSVWTWGLNTSGQLGINNTTSSNVPVQVADPDDPTGKLTDVIAIGAGKDSSFAVKSDGTAWGWGANSAWQIGVGAEAGNKLLPVQILLTDRSNRMFELLGPYFITPGEAVHYAVRYKNVTNSILEDTIALVELPGTLEYVQSGSGGIHWPARHHVFWKLDDLQPGDTGVLSLEVNVRWGLEPHSLSNLRADIGARSLSSSINIDEYLVYEDIQVIERHELSEEEIQTLIANNSDFATNLEYAKSLGYLDFGLGYHVLLNSTEEFSFLSLLDMEEMKPVFVISTSGGSVIEEIGQFERKIYDHTGGYSLNIEDYSSRSWGDWTLTHSPSIGDCTKNCVASIALETLATFEDVYLRNLASRSENCSVCWFSYLLDATDRSSCRHCSMDMTPSKYLRIIATCGAVCSDNTTAYECVDGQVGSACLHQTTIFPYWDLSMPVEEQSVLLYQCILNENGSPIWENVGYERCEKDQVCVDGKCSDNICSSTKSRDVNGTYCSDNELHHDHEVVTASDPNEKSVNVVGDVLPGQTLDYTIDFENVGAGTAYEVFILDQLDEDLDANSLSINDGGNYSDGARLLDWSIGELVGGEQGSVSFSVDVDASAVPGSEVVNTADIYFPSAGEITPTNAVVNRVASIKAEPQDVQTTGRAPVVIDLYGEDTVGSSLSYTVTSEPLYGELTGMPPSVVYTAMEEFSGLDELHFTVDNGTTTSNPARVTITVLPDPTDTNPPDVTRMSPEPGATGVVAGDTPITTEPDLYTPFISATFSEPLDGATINDTSFTVDGVTGTVGYDELTRRVSFSPSAPLTAATTYTARLHTSITDKAGNALPEEHSWQFTTASPANISVSLPDPVLTHLDLRVSPVGVLSAERILTVASTGQLDLSIGSLGISGTDAGDFQLNDDDCSTATLVPGHYCTVALAFQPGDEGIREATLTIPSNDEVNPVYEVSMEGLGVTPSCSGDAVTVASTTFPAGLSICHGSSSVTTSASVGTAIRIPAGAEVHFIAPGVSLNPGFRVSGGEFHVGTDYIPEAAVAP